MLILHHGINCVLTAELHNETLYHSYGMDSKTLSYKAYSTYCQLTVRSIAIN